MFLPHMTGSELYSNCDIRAWLIFANNNPLAIFSWHIESKVNNIIIIHWTNECVIGKWVQSNFCLSCTMHKKLIWKTYLITSMFVWSWLWHVCKLKQRFYICFLLGKWCRLLEIILWFFSYPKHHHTLHTFRHCVADGQIHRNTIHDRYNLVVFEIHIEKLTTDLEARLGDHGRCTYRLRAQKYRSWIWIANYYVQHLHTNCPIGHTFLYSLTLYCTSSF